MRKAAEQPQFTESDMAFCIYNASGCELYSNKRDMKLYFCRTTYFDIATNIEYRGYNVSCFVLNNGGWARGQNYMFINNIEDYIRSLRASFEFSKAVNEYDKTHACKH